MLLKTTIIMIIFILTDFFEFVHFVRASIHWNLFLEHIMWMCWKLIFLLIYLLLLLLMRR